MCGIVGAASRRDIVPVLVEGLRRLEYRGYDSAGIAVVNGASVRRVRAAGRVAELAAQTDAQQQCSGTAVRNTSIAADSQRITKPFACPVYKLKVAVR